MFLLENAGRPTEVADQPVAAVVVNGEANENGEIQKFDIEKKEYGIGSDALPAAQASALASVIEGLVDGNVPSYRYTAAGGLGFLLAISGLGGIGVMVALGFYMPFNIVLTYTIGCVLRVVCNKTAGNRWAEEFGIPIAAGLIIGEALVDVGFTLPKVFEGLFQTMMI
jgi:uncharacterized oligopeptide transporter (OPT) family protein